METKIITKKQYFDLKHFRRLIVEMDKKMDAIFTHASEIVGDKSDEFYDVIINGDNLEKYLQIKNIKVRDE